MKFWNCPNLQNLELKDCKIKKIRTFNFPNLERVDLSSNFVKDISALSSWNCPKLKVIIF